MSPRAMTPARILTENTSKEAVTRSDVLFGVAKHNLSFKSHFTPVRHLGAWQIFSRKRL